MKSWKTTVCGILALVGTLVTQFFPEWARWGGFIAALGTGVGLLLARDNDKTSEQAGAAKGAGVAPGLSVLLALLLPTVFLCGCAPLQPGADAVEVRAEQTIATAADTLNLVEQVDNDNRELLKAKAPEVHKFAEWLREPVKIEGETWPRGLGFVESANRVRLAYKSNRTAENKASMLTALATLETALQQAQAQLTEANAVIATTAAK